MTITRNIRRPNTNMTYEQCIEWLQRNWPEGIGRQFAIQQGTFTNDTPNTDSVTWAGVVIEYNGQQYRITDGNTSNKWIYWELATPTVLATAAACPAITADLIVVGVNVSGVFTAGWKAGQGIQAAMIAGLIIADQLDADAINGMTITGALIQTEATADRGTKLTTDNFTAYNGSGDIKFRIVATGLLQGRVYVYELHSLSAGASMLFGETGIASNVDLDLPTAGTGIILWNAAGTVTKRVRLNDAGDGLIYEAP